MTDILNACAGQPERHFAPGEVLIEEGVEADLLLVLVKGSVRVIKSGTEVARLSDPGAIFGEISALLGTPTSARVEAITSVRVRLIENAGALLAESPDLALHTARILAHRLLGATAYLADIKRQFADRSDHFGMVDQVLDRLLQQQDRWTGPGRDEAPGDDPRL